MSQTSCEEVIRQEHAAIESQRQRRGVDPRRRGHVGLALSGGGIRSASFAIGVLQGLSAADLLKHIDYLSTVSGGGYAGSAYTWSNYQARRKGRAAAFPFGSKGRGARTTATENPSTPLAPDALAYIRQHGNYLTPTAGLSALALAGVVLRNIVVCFSVYTAGLVGAILALGLIWPFVQVALHPAGQPAGATSSAYWDYLLPAGLLLLLFAGCALAYSLVTWFMAKFFSKSSATYSGRIFYQVFAGGLLTLAAWFAIAGTVPIVISEVHALWSKALLVAGTSGVGLAGVVYEFLTQHRKSIPKFPRLTATRVIVTAAALLYGWLLIAYVLADLIADLCKHEGWPVEWGLVAVLGYFLAFGFFINTNLFGVGRMYRDRLMEAFMPSDEAVQENAWARASEADNAFLPDICTRDDPGPYHLINSNVILTQAKNSRYRNRAGDNFVMANLYCGSDATGWYPTREAFAEMSLATAIAISGAAVNPNTGGGGEGLTRNQFVAFMLALFNIRLGYWVRNPKLLDRHRGLFSWLWPNLLQPGLRQGLLGSGQHEEAAYLELTDGGHFDNTGLYELIRREVDTIVLSLASADPDYSLEDFAIAVERVRADFGVSIDFAEDSFKDLAPGSYDSGPATPAAAAAKTYSIAALQLSRKGYAVADIRYRNRNGTLIVVKSSMVAGVPVDTVVYKLAHADFPNQSTADQFFSERQFEAYREIGYQITKQMLADTELAQSISDPLSRLGSGTDLGSGNPVR